MATQSHRCEMSTQADPDRKQISGGLGLQEEGKGVEDRVSLRGDGKALGSDSGDSCLCPREEL